MTREDQAYAEAMNLFGSDLETADSHQVFVLQDDILEHLHQLADASHKPPAGTATEENHS